MVLAVLWRVRVGLDSGPDSRSGLKSASDSGSGFGTPSMSPHSTATHAHTHTHTHTHIKTMNIIIGPELGPGLRLEKYFRSAGWPCRRWPRSRPSVTPKTRLVWVQVRGVTVTVRVCVRVTAKVWFRVRVKVRVKVGWLRR